ncbi:MULTISPECIES: hypothetical protein [Cupriavidus]
MTMNEYTQDRLTNELRDHVTVLYANEVERWKDNGFSIVHRQIDVAADKQGRITGAARFTIVKGEKVQHPEAFFTYRQPPAGKPAYWYCDRDWRDYQQASPNLQAKPTADKQP